MNRKEAERRRLLRRFKELVKRALRRRGRVIINPLRMGAIKRNHKSASSDLVGAALIGGIGIDQAVKIYQVRHSDGRNQARLEAMLIGRASSHLGMPSSFLEALQKKALEILDEIQQELAVERKKKRKEKKKRPK